MQGGDQGGKLEKFKKSGATQQEQVSVRSYEKPHLQKYQKLEKFKKSGANDLEKASWCRRLS